MTINQEFHVQILGENVRCFATLFARVFALLAVRGEELVSENSEGGNPNRRI